MKRSDKLIRAVCLIVLLAVACYIVYFIYDRITDPFVTAYVAAIEAQDSFDCEGFVVRDEITFSVSGSYTGIEVRDGERVYKGQAVAAVYGTQAAYARALSQKELQLKLESLGMLAGSAGSQDTVAVNIARLGDAARRGGADELALASAGLDALLLSGEGADKDSVEEMYAQTQLRLEALREISASDTRYVYAAQAGIFSSRCDGFEHIGIDDVMHVDPASLGALFDNPADSSLCRLVTGIDWCFAAAVGAEDAAKLKTGDEVLLKLDSLSEALPVSVAGIVRDGNGGMCTAVFTSSRNLADVLDLRHENAVVIVARTSGFSVPAEAVRSDESGTYVYIVSALQARRADVTVVGSYGENAVIISDSSLVFDRARVIVRAKDLYDGKVVD